MSQEQTEKKWLLIYIFPALILGVFLIAYWPVFHKMSIRWSAGDNSYCYLIVPLFLYLCWDKQGKTRNQKSGIRNQKEKVGKTKEEIIEQREKSKGKRAESRNQKSEVKKCG